MKTSRAPHLSYLLLLSLLIFFSSCHRNSHFITDRAYRQQVTQDYESRLVQIPMLDTLLQLDTLCRAESEAMQFLYAYMPYSDLADYDPTFFLDQVRYAFTAREQMPWGKTIPEDIFRHFVLVYRVNNENLDTARMAFYHSLKERVQGMTMEQAALEVNHWCHEHVAYRAADSRTSAPLATMRTSLGRCGEESTFAVTALRAVGIPARQCYTPRWAHCDDNHAWVEVWVANPDCKGGEWKFLGACEPDPELNMGWFAVPSTRCLMVHSKAFGRYHGDEEVVRQTALYSELNLLSHYAPTRRVTVTVTDPQGKPLPSATVKFKMYNYAEYYTLATYQADALEDQEFVQVDQFPDRLQIIHRDVREIPVNQMASDIGMPFLKQDDRMQTALFQQGSKQDRGVETCAKFELPDIVRETDSLAGSPDGCGRH